MEPSPQSSRPDTVDVLGVPVATLTLPDLLDWVETAVTGHGHHTIGYANVHVINEACKAPDLLEWLQNTDVCYCDGNGVVMGARLLGETLPERMTGADWIWDLAQRCEGRLRLYWIGSEPGVTGLAAQKLTERFPGLEIETDHGFHPRQGPENQACIDRINAFSPHIVLVGMGTPEQERWVAARRESIEAPLVWCLGATADFIAGKVKRPGPQWLVENHEWLSRLMADPKRLWKRYLLGNAVFLGRVLGRRFRG